MRGKDICEEWLRIEAAAESLCDELVVELEKVDSKLAARTGKRMKVIEVEVGGKRDSNPNQGQHCCGGKQELFFWPRTDNSSTPQRRQSC